MSRENLTEDDLANMSDDEIMGMTSVPAVAAAQTQADEEGNAGTEEIAQDDSRVVDDAGVADENSDGDDADSKADPAEEKPETTADQKTEDQAFLDQSDEEIETAKPKAKSSVADEKVKADPVKEDLKPVAAETPAVVAPPVETPKTEAEYKTAYDKIMAPFKANGKEFKPENPDEAVRLMQMGANYTKKLQALQPQLKLLKMLENNKLLDESKLTYLIDLERKNPAAIRKLIKDSGIDPMDIDTEKDPGYKPGNYQVSDEHMRFTSAVEEVASEPGGKDLISTIHKTWDKESKDALFTDPAILHILTTQKKNGIYAQIFNEVERRKTLGTIQSNASFLKSYHEVGNDLQAKGLLKITTLAPTEQKIVPAPVVPGQAAPVVAAKTAEAKPVVAPVAQRTVVDQGVRKTSSPVVNSDKARAALATKAAGSKKVANDFNPLSMSDEDFEKNSDLARRV